jgi:CO/xanthine dehydrogenase FAD-binding subunit
VSSSFGFARPESLREASDALARLPGARVLAGGTDLLVALRSRRAQPTALVDVTRIPELLELRQEPDGSLRLGAALSHQRLAESPLVRREAPVLARAAGSVGSVQVRNLGTIGGNVANASTAADTLPALAVSGASFEVFSLEGERVLSFEEFFTGPGRTALAPAEVLVAILLPPLAPHGAAFLKVGRRRAAAISRLSVAVLAEPRSGLARVALGAVFPTPRRVPAAEAALRSGFGADACEGAARAAEEAVRAVSGSRSSMGYKLPAIRGTVARAAAEALADAGRAAA